MNGTTGIICPVGVNLRTGSVTTTYTLAPSPYAVLHIGSAVTLHARPEDTDPAVLRDLAAHATDIANWLEKQNAKAGELDAA
jgi:hypothetical protein